MRSFKTKWFTRWADEVGLEESMLLKALDEIKGGLVDASLGGNVFKKRVAKLGQGKRGGYRTIVAFKSQNKAFFIYGFSKNQRENITAKELLLLKKLSVELLGYSEQQLKKTIDKGELIEVSKNG